MKRLSILILILFCSKIFATEQIKDSLVYNGKGYYIENQFLFKEILYNYVTQNGFYDDNYPSSNLWRGYRAVFEIDNNKLLLKDLQIKIDTVDTKGYYYPFFKSVISKKIIDVINEQMFSGILILTDGYLNDEYRFTLDDEYYPNYKIAEFENSVLTKTLDFKYEEIDGFKSEQFQKYKNTNFYRKDLRNCKKSKKQSLKEYLKSNQTQMAEYEKQLDCSNFIKAFLFENPFYTHIL